ncbi:site-specific integrase [Mycobacterium colombiense]|uniref:tyrosine-type recombinase/integrase n=1 Tax=Mycobacterium colombiense TaxID=339268 RepID=UPI002016A240|nr:site-specific integrase [Mycobacterium colombiense]
MAATIRKRTTKQLDKFGNPVVSYQVRWLEPIRDEFGAPTGKFKQTSETFPTERKAKAHMRKVENQLEDARGIDPSSAKAKANRPLGEYAKQYLDGLVGTVDLSTIEDYAKIYRRHIAAEFGSKPVAAITTADVARFRASLLAPHPQRSFVTRGKARRKPTTTPRTGLVTRSPKTVKHIVGTLKRILDVAVDDQAIPSNPVIAGRRHSTKRRVASNGKAPFKHRPLASNEIAALHDWIATERGNPVYALAVVFAAYTGVRVAELQGLQVQDITLSDFPGTVGSVRIVRTKKKGRAVSEGDEHDEQAPLVWIEGTPKSDASTDRTIPLAPWLADDMRDYLTRIHPFCWRQPPCPRAAVSWQAHPRGQVCRSGGGFRLGQADSG